MGPGFPSFPVSGFSSVFIGFWGSETCRNWNAGLLMQQWRIPGRRTGEEARRKSSRVSGRFSYTLLTSIYKYSVPLFLFINAIQYLKHDTLIIMIITYGTRVLRCTQNTSRRSLSQQGDARSRWAMVVCLFFESWGIENLRARFSFLLWVERNLYPIWLIIRTWHERIERTLYLYSTKSLY